MRFQLISKNHDIMPLRSIFKVIGNLSPIEENINENHQKAAEKNYS